MVSKIRLSLSRKDVHAVGRVAVWASMLDTLLEITLWNMLGVGPVAGRKLTQRMSADQLRKWLTSLATNGSVLTPQQSKTLLNMMARVGPVMENRNVVVHGHWYIGPGDVPYAAKFDDKGEPTFDGRLTMQEISPTADAAKKLAAELEEWLTARDANALQNAFRQKSRGTRKTLRPLGRSHQMKPTNGQKP